MNCNICLVIRNATFLPINSPNSKDFNCLTHWVQMMREPHLTYGQQRIQIVTCAPLLIKVDGCTHWCLCVFIAKSENLLSAEDLKWTECWNQTSGQGMWLCGSSSSWSPAFDTRLIYAHVLHWTISTSILQYNLCIPVIKYQIKYSITLSWITLWV